MPADLKRLLLFCRLFLYKLMVCSLSRRLRLLNCSPVLFSLHSQRRQCDSTASKEFLFDEDKAGRKYRIYKHTANSKTVCLGVTSNCNHKTLSLISTNGQDRRCYFVKRKHC